MDSHSVILRINDCLRTSHEGPSRTQLLDICRENLHLTGAELFDAFRGHLDLVRLRNLASTWDTWRGLLLIDRTTAARNSSGSRKPIRRRARQRRAAYAMH